MGEEALAVGKIEREELTENVKTDVLERETLSDTARSEVAAADATMSFGTAVAPGRELTEPTAKRKKRYVYRIIKRAFDIVSSGLALVILGIPILLCLLVKWMEDKKISSYRLEIREVPEDERSEARKGWITRRDGKVFECKLIPDKTQSGKKAGGPIYTSVRVGKNGKFFKFHKIRSMCPGAEDMKGQLIDAGLNEADEPAFKMKDDPRITKFGKFLRKTSIDELPQLWDIFVGRMSVVGPRSPLPDEVKAYTEEQKHRLDVKGGVLCLWQIQKNRNSLSFDEWVKLDLEYIEKQSVWLDMKIIFKGAYMVLFDHSGE